MGSPDDDDGGFAIRPEVVDELPESGGHAPSFADLAQVESPITDPDPMLGGGEPSAIFEALQRYTEDDGGLLGFKESVMLAGAARST